MSQCGPIQLSETGSFVQGYRLELQYCITTLSLVCKVVCVRTPGEVDRFNTQRSTLISAATCQIDGNL